MVACPACGKENPDGFQFCGFCGAALEAPAIFAAKERKVVSVLFCDLVGFTAASEAADPEEVQARVARTTLGRVSASRRLVGQSRSSSAML